MTIGWVKIKFRRYGGVVYEEKAIDALKDDFDLEYIGIDSKFFKKGFLRTPELIFNLLKLKGKKDLWIRDTNSVITAPFDRTKGKKIAIIHHIDFSTTRLLFKPTGFVVEKLIYWSLKKMDAVITVSEYWRSRLLKKGCSNIFVIYNSFDLDNFNISEEETEEFKKKHHLTKKPIIYIGNCQKPKGVVESYQSLKDLDVYLISSGRPQVKIPAINLEIEYREYLKLLKAASVVVTMSKFKEGWCRTAHEAMLLKTPVIGSGLGGMKELLEGGKQIVCPEFSFLKSKVEHLLNHPEIRKKMGENGYNFAEDFTSERFRNDWLVLIKRLL